MKKVPLIFLFIFSFSIGLVFLSQAEYKDFITNQLATVLGINVPTLYNYQTSRGLQRDLAMRDKGIDVKLVQYALTKIVPDFSEENVTGFFGEKTFAAVRTYQKEEGIPVTGEVDSITRENLNEIYVEELCPEIESNSVSDEILLQVNKKKPLSKKYLPEDLIKIDSSIKTTSVICLKKDVVPYLKRMFEDAARRDVYLAVTSGFRKPEIQTYVYSIWERVIGERVKNEVALAYYSEHQLGTAIDITGASNNYVGADDNFDQTKESEWLRENAHRYGFVMSYPKNKTSITGYIYEPWHYRFVGIKAAKEIFKEKVSVEEYLR